MPQVQKPKQTPPLPPLIREVKLIDRYSRSNFPDDLRFREYLKTRLNMPREQTDLIVKETTDEVWSQIDCVACANCCKTLSIEVDAKDITKLAARLHISMAQFKTNYCEVLPDKTVVLKSRPCVFLADDGKCKVYEDRPRACMDYPYLAEPHFVARSISMVENCRCCPIVFNVWQQLKVKLGFRGVVGKAGPKK